jgi:hypothetical protein
MKMQIKSYLQLIKEQIINQIKGCLLKRPTRSLSVGAVIAPRHLVEFKVNQN